MIRKYIRDFMNYRKLVRINREIRRSSEEFRYQLICFNTLEVSQLDGGRTLRPTLDQMAGNAWRYLILLNQRDKLLAST